MGDELADNLQQQNATGVEFRTQPLWGISAVGPYLHDGRAGTIDEAIMWHGGEAEKSKSAYNKLTEDEKKICHRISYDTRWTLPNFTRTFTTR